MACGQNLSVYGLLGLDGDGNPWTLLTRHHESGYEIATTHIKQMRKEKRHQH